MVNRESVYFETGSSQFPVAGRPQKAAVLRNKEAQKALIARTLGRVRYVKRHLGKTHREVSLPEMVISPAVSLAAYREWGGSWLSCQSGASCKPRENIGILTWHRNLGRLRPWFRISKCTDVGRIAKPLEVAYLDGLSEVNDYSVT